LLIRVICFTFWLGSAASFSYECFRCFRSAFPSAYAFVLNVLSIFLVAVCGGSLGQAFPFGVVTLPGTRDPASPSLPG